MSTKNLYVKLRTKIVFLFENNCIFTARPGRKSSSGTPITPDSARSTGRSRSRIGSIGGSGAVSQPGSRSTSPSSIKSYHTYFDAAGQVCTKEPAQRNEISLDLEFRSSVANFVFCNFESWWHWISTQNNPWCWFWKFFVNVKPTFAINIMVVFWKFLKDWKCNL